jgi:predicted alpha/beta-hydrolase family hydrolase
MPLLMITFMQTAKLINFVLQVELTGRSMGSRSAVAVCCDKTMIDFVLGVICLSYPLHRPRVYTQLRDEPLYEIRKPILFVSGTDDDMCKQELFLPVLVSQQTATADLDPIDRPVIYDTLIDRCLIPDYHMYFNIFIISLNSI